MSEPMTRPDCEARSAGAFRGTPYVVPDFWGRSLGPAAAQVCEYPLVGLSRSADMRRDGCGARLPRPTTITEVVRSR